MDISTSNLLRTYNKIMFLQWLVERMTVEIMEEEKNETNHRQQQIMMKNNDTIDYRGERMTEIINSYQWRVCCC